MTRQAKSASILVVDDDDDIRETVVEILEGEGHTVAQATNGVDALGYLRRQGHPRLIILDLRMPVMDGWQFHREMQEDSTLAGIPVVVVSAHRDGEAPVPVAASRFLRKPFEVRELLALVSRYCQ